MLFFYIKYTAKWNMQFQKIFQIQTTHTGYLIKYIVIVFVNKNNQCHNQPTRL